VPNVIGMDKHTVLSNHANCTVFGVAWRAWVHKCGLSGVRVSISVGFSQVNKGLLHVGANSRGDSTLLLD